MLISTKGRYALSVMVDLAEHEKEGYVALGDIAARQGMSKKYLEAIIKDLVKEEFVKEGNAEWFEMLVAQTDYADKPFEEYKKEMARYIYTVRA